MMIAMESPPPYPRRRRHPNAAICLLIVASSGSLPAPTSSFVPASSSSSTTTTWGTSSTAGAGPSTSELFLSKPSAKKKKKQKKKSSSSGGGGGGGGGGFGAAPVAKKPRKDQDYSVFPALEDGVRETLIPVPPDEEELNRGVYGGGIDGGIYERVDQIYGFKRFNYEEGEEEEEEEEEGGDEAASLDELMGSSSSSPSIDFADLLGSGSSKPAFGMGSSSSSGGGGGGDDLSDLIASATGGGGGGGSSPPSPAPAPAPLPPVAKLNLSSLSPFSEIRVLHVDPCVLAVDDFFTPEECDAYVALSTGGDDDDSGEGGDAILKTQSKTVGKDSRAKAQRTSTTWFHNFRSVPELMAKASRLLGVNGIERWEEPQTVRYRKTERFTWHLDALAPSDDLSAAGGQRVATLLVYLTDLSEEEGGATMFRDLTGPDGKAPLKMRPKKGSALLFFPAAGGIPDVPFDVRTLHAGEAVAEESSSDKWIAQLWLREDGGYVPTAPPNNVHADAAEAINAYCDRAP